MITIILCEAVTIAILIWYTLTYWFQLEACKANYEGLEHAHLNLFRWHDQVLEAVQYHGCTLADCEPNCPYQGAPTACDCDEEKTA